VEEIMDINKIITESISALINEDKTEIVTEGIKEAADTAKEAVTKAGEKVADTAKEAVKEGHGVFQKTKEIVAENPKTSAAAAAALAAGLGAVAFRKKLAALAKKGVPVAKKKTAVVAKKIAKKLES